MVAAVAFRPSSPAPETSLRIDLLGPPRIFQSDVPLMIPRRQLRALLYRLAAARDPVPREQLCFLFWPDLPEGVARRNLVVLLNHLRRALPDAAALISTTEAVGLDHRAIASDVVLAADAIADAAAGGAPGLGRLAIATDLYRGPFLDGFALPDCEEFEAWLVQERETWQRRYLDALGALIQGYAEAGEYPDAIVAARRYLAVDQLAETVHRRLIALYAVTGDRSAALRQFERCAVVLDGELGVRPQPETRAVYEAVRAGRALVPDRRDAAPPARRASERRATGSASVPSAPLPSNPLIGRETEVGQACVALAGDEVRLLTMCGPGGSGKTRLALEVAWRLQERFADGVVFVPLAPVRDPALVPAAIAQACGLQQAGAATPDALLRAHVRDRCLLLVLDNCEHLLAAASVVAGLLAAAPGLRVLATSRSLLNLAGEHAQPVAPLPLPDLDRLLPPPELAAQPSVALLHGRAQAVVPTFQVTAANAADLAAICVRLDGLPLAIELAAARLKLLSPRALLDRLDQRLVLLGPGARDLPERQRTMRAAIDWSYGLLDAEGRALFARLAVFAGGFTPSAAEAICVEGGEAARPILDGLAGLLDANLLKRDAGADGEVRLGMLETIRAYAIERLRDRGEEQALQRAHARYFCAYAEQRGSPPEATSLPAAYSELDRDYHNIRAALDWAIEANEAGIAARLAGSLLMYWDMRGLFEEGRTWQARVLDMGAAVPQPFRTRLIIHAGLLAYRQGHCDEALGVATTVLADPRTAPAEVASAANLAGQAAMEAEDIDGARRHYARAMAVATEHRLFFDLSRAQFDLGYVYLVQGEFAEAERLFRASLVTGERLRHPRNVGCSLVGLGYIAVLRLDTQQAAALLDDALHVLMAVRDTTPLLYGLLACAALATVQQQPSRAAMLFASAMEQADRVGARLPRALVALAHRWIDRARGQTTGDSFERSWKEGAALPFEDAVALAAHGVCPESVAASGA